MAGALSKTNPPRARKRVEADTNTLKRARDGSAFTRCEACNKDVPVVLIDMHSCSLDSKIRMTLESQVVEKAADVKKPVERKRAAPADRKERKGKKEKKSKDPRAPKRPPTAFFLFMDDFRKEYKESHPDSKSVSKVAKEGGEKWKSMTDEERKPYVDRAAELKAEYEKEKEKLNEENEEEEIEESAELKAERVKEKEKSNEENEEEEKEETEGSEKEEE